MKLMDRKKTSHKGENGNALVIGGSEEFTTAPALAALAAMRAGCDAATVAAPEKVAWTINMLSLDLMTIKIPGDTLNIKNVKDALRVAEFYDAVLIGNGITRRGDKFCHTFVRKCMKPKIIDADALKALSFKDFSNAIVTAHETELEIMLVNSGKEFLLQKLRASNYKERAEILQGNLRYFLQNNNVLLVKGATDMIISRNKVAFNRTGNQGMTKAGTGDILAGLCLGFLSKTGDMFKSAVAASFINGFVGDKLLDAKKGYTFIASDILLDMEKLQKSAEELGDRERVVLKRKADVKRKEDEARAKIVAKEKAEKSKEKLRLEKERLIIKKKLAKEKEIERIKKDKVKSQLMKQKLAEKKKKEAEKKKALTLKKKALAAKKKEKEANRRKKLAEMKKKVASKKSTAKKKVVKKKSATKKKPSKKKAASKKKPAAKKKAVSRKKVVKKKATKKKSKKKK